MSDRVVVMHERRIKGVLERHQLTQVAIAALMTGRESAAHTHSRAEAERARP